MDILLFVNTIVNFIILVTAQRLQKQKARTWRLIIASFIGSLFCLTVFINARSFFLSLGIKLLSTLVIAAIAFCCHSLKELLKAALMTFSVSLVFSGLMTAVYQLFKPPNMMIVNDVVYFEFDPLVLIILTVVIYTIVYILERLFRERLRASVVRLAFTVFDKDYACVGKIDTGCSLVEPFSGAPVIIADAAVLTIPDDAIRRVIPYTALGVSSVLFAVRADTVSINGKAVKNEVYIAQGRIPNTAYQAIINSEITR